MDEEKSSVGSQAMSYLSPMEKARIWAAHAIMGAWEGRSYPPDLARENARLRDDLEIARFVIATLEGKP